MQYKITTLTPLLVGDGKELSPVDYMVWKDQVNVLDQARIFRLLARSLQYPPQLDAPFIHDAFTTGIINRARAAASMAGDTGAGADTPVACVISGFTYASMPGSTTWMAAMMSAASSTPPATG